MRVIAGTARRLQLVTPEGMDTRPTTDRIKETLFNIIWRDVTDVRFLDCFAGSGSIGIEALSRGAESAVFIEKNPRAADCIRRNLKTTHFEDKGLVMVRDIMDALKQLERKKQVFGVIFMDPPYDRQWEKQVLEYLKESSLADENTLIIVEASLETDLSYAEGLGFSVIRNKEYKTNKHIFLRKTEKKEQTE